MKPEDRIKTALTLAAGLADQCGKLNFPPIVLAGVPCEMQTLASWFRLSLGAVDELADPLTTADQEKLASEFETRLQGFEFNLGSEDSEEFFVAVPNRIRALCCEVQL